MIIKDLIKHEKNILLERQVLMAADLAKIASQLLELEQIKAENEVEPKACTAQIETYRAVYVDEGYFGGYKEDINYPLKRLEVRAQQFSTLYLAALAMQSSPLPERDDEEPNPSLMPDVNEINLVAIRIDKSNILSQQPPKMAKELLNQAKGEALEVVFDLEDQIYQNNPIKDVPMRPEIQDELLDALLRQAILDYCQQIDPDFTVCEIAPPELR